MRKITFPKGEGLPTCNYGSKKLGHRGRRAAQSFYKVTFMMGDKKGALVLVLFLFVLAVLWGFSWWFSGKKSTCNAGDVRDSFGPRVGKISWRRSLQPTKVFLPGESHRQRSPVGYSPQHHKESETTQHTRTQIRILKQSHSLLAIYSHAKLLQCY